jgi:formylglycine-generating enzyme required for sulfatase activity
MRITGWLALAALAVFNLQPITALAQGTALTPKASTAATAASLAIPSGMALIPAGAFRMGDTLDGNRNATPPISVTVSAFYMDTNLVSYSQWQSVYNWATNHGYGFVHAGSGKVANHPVQRVDWYDVVKWCNARS